MKIHTNSRDRLIARLDSDDMERYGIAFSSLDINDENTERLIKDLLSMSEITLKSRACRLNVDAIFSGEGEMFIILTLSPPLHRRARRLRLRDRRYLCLLFSQECLFGLCDALSPHRNIITESKLFSCGGSYAVEVSQKALDKINLKHILSEFGAVQTCSGRIADARINEHYKLICTDFIGKLSP